MKASLPLLVVAAAAGVWLGFVLIVLRFFGVHVA
jgi:hypothetical protein